MLASVKLDVNAKYRDVLLQTISLGESDAEDIFRQVSEPLVAKEVTRVVKLLHAQEDASSICLPPDLLLAMLSLLQTGCLGALSRIKQQPKDVQDGLLPGLVLMFDIEHQLRKQALAKTLDPRVRQNLALNSHVWTEISMPILAKLAE